MGQTTERREMEIKSITCCAILWTMDYRSIKLWFFFVAVPHISVVYVVIVITEKKNYNNALHVIFVWIIKNKILLLLHFISLFHFLDFSFFHFLYWIIVALIRYRSIVDIYTHIFIKCIETEKHSWFCVIHWPHFDKLAANCFLHLNIYNSETFRVFFIFFLQ